MVTKTGRAKTPTQKAEGDLLNDAFARITRSKQAERDLDDDEPEAAPVASAPAAKGKGKTGKAAAAAAADKSKNAPRLAVSNDLNHIARSKAKSAEITYHPGNDDKPYAIWYGMKFEANVPKTVHNQELIESARTNPWFSVDGKRAPKHARPIKNDDEEMDYSKRSGGAKMPDGEDPDEVEVEMQSEHLIDA